MWIKRDLLEFIAGEGRSSVLPIKVLKGPRQVGKTSLLEKLGTHTIVSFDDLHTRRQAQDNPSLFLDQFIAPVVLDEATLAPEIFFELKKRVDEIRRHKLKGTRLAPVDVWITGSNQTLLRKQVQESLAGRASYFDLNTLSLHERGNCPFSDFMMRGGWPELHTDPTLSPTRYLNDLISTFIERDIVQAAGIEKRDKFSKALSLCAGQVGELINLSTIAAEVGVESSTINSWIGIAEQNGIVHVVRPYSSNLNKRLIRTPKIFFRDVGLAIRFQGWSEYLPFANSPYLGHMIENLVFSEVANFFSNNALELKIYFVRSKERVEIDFLLELPNQRFIAIEAKNSPRPFSSEQIALLESLKINICDYWVVSPNGSGILKRGKIVPIQCLYDNLKGALI